MKVFNTFFKITKKNIGTLFIYLVIFFGVSILNAMFGNNNQVESFESAKITMAVIDRDQSTSSQGIRNYLSQNHYLKELKDDKEVFQDELYNNNVSYILIIPKNFQQDLIAGKEVKCENIQTPNSFSGMYVNMQLEQYLKLLKNYLSLDVDPEIAVEQTLSLTSQNTQVSMRVKETTAHEVPPYYAFFALMPYPLAAILISMLGVILLIFNKEDLKKRMICSSLTLRKRNFQLALASLLISFIVLLLLIVLPLVIYGTGMFANPIYKYLVLNSFAFLFVAMSLGFLAGTLSKTDEHVAMYSTSFSMLLCFLGGVFVPLSLMPEKVIYFSKLLPSYWYTQGIEIMQKNRIIVGETYHNLMCNIGIQFLFAIVIFGISLVISRQRAQEA